MRHRPVETYLGSGYKSAILLGLRRYICKTLGRYFSLMLETWPMSTKGICIQYGMPSKQLIGKKRNLYVKEGI